MAHYSTWEARQNKHAQALAEQILDLYSRGQFTVAFTTNQTKHVMTYVLMKVYHILWGSTPSLGFLGGAKKHGDMTRVRLRLFEQSTLELEEPTQP